MTTALNAEPEMATLQMIRAELNTQEFQRWMGTRRLQDADHAMHCLLVECFGDLAPKPFQLIAPRTGSTSFLYGYGLAGADALREASAIYADPLQERILRASTLDSKPMPTVWQTGKRLGFDIRIRPVVRLLRNPSVRTERPTAVRSFKDGSDRRGKECDAFLWEAMLHPERGGMERKREQVYAEWLSSQLDRIGGARLDVQRTKLVSFQRTRAIRKLHARYSEGPDAVMRGILTITDAEAFFNLLTRGVGRHRAFGYGMLLLRPARA